MSNWRNAAPIDDIREPLCSACDASGPIAIATLVAVDGSAPRDVGAQMLITAEEYWGFLSGGCIEADVARHAREAMAEGAPRMLRYGEGSPWFDIKLACGSGINVLVEPLSPDEDAVAQLIASYTRRAPLLWSSDGTERNAIWSDTAPANGWDGSRYTRLFEPRLRLVLIGEDGATLASAALAIEMGWDVVLVTPGGPEAPPFPGITYFRTAPSAAIEAVGIDRWTAIAVLSHDREDDERGLAAALKTETFYVGAIGARARLDGRIAKLRAQGVDESGLARLHAPIGLYGFGKAPCEVALSLVAEVAQAFQARSTTARSSDVSISSSAPASVVSQ